MILRCPNCTPHEFQDKRYGRGMRIMNPCKGGTSVRCTVCGKETQLSSAQIKEEQLEKKGATKK